MMLRFTGICLLLLTACATPVPPRQLLDARAAYQKVRQGTASRLAPAELREAELALIDAEAAFGEDPESAQTHTLAYVALRRAQLVESQANTKEASQDLKSAAKEREQLRDSELKRTRAELSKEKQELASTSAALEKERAARAAAEQREREAMQKLAQAAAVDVKQEARGTVIVLPGNVLFASGKYELTSAAQRKLTLVAGTLAPQSENHDIVVEGHTDSRGSRDFNMSLSDNRAQAVMNYLVTRGVTAESITAVGIGPDRPIADNSNRQGRAENRRVEIIVKPMEPK